MLVVRDLKSSYCWVPLNPRSVNTPAPSAPCAALVRLIRSPSRSSIATGVLDQALQLRVAIGQTRKRLHGNCRNFDHSEVFRARKAGRDLVPLDIGAAPAVADHDYLARARPHALRMRCSSGWPRSIHCSISPVSDLRHKSGSSSVLRPRPNSSNSSACSAKAGRALSLLLGDRFALSRATNETEITGQLFGLRPLPQSIAVLHQGAGFELFRVVIPCFLKFSLRLLLTCGYVLLGCDYGPQ